MDGMDFVRYDCKIRRPVDLDGRIPPGTCIKLWMMKMTIQIAVNMATALIVFIGGLVLAFAYSEQLPNQYRVLIVLFVTFYFSFRMAQSVLAIKRERRRREGLLGNTDDKADDGL